MTLAELCPGLHRWTAEHPDAEPDPKPGSPSDWGPEVGCVAYDAEDALLLVDPLVPEDGSPALDALVERHGRPVTLFVTLPFHRRSREAVMERYGATEAVPAGVETITIDARARRCSGYRSRARSSRATASSATAPVAFASAPTPGFGTWGTA